MPFGSDQGRLLPGFGKRGTGIREFVPFIGCTALAVAGSGSTGELPEATGATSEEREILRFAQDDKGLRDYNECMAQPIQVDNSRPATVRDTAETLGVSKKRTDELSERFTGMPRPGNS
jgi:hypothetical protein